MCDTLDTCCELSWKVLDRLKEVSMPKINCNIHSQEVMGRENVFNPSVVYAPHNASRRYITPHLLSLMATWSIVWHDGHVNMTTAFRHAQYTFASTNSDVSTYWLSWNFFASWNLPPLTPSVLWSLITKAFPGWPQISRNLICKKSSKRTSLKPYRELKLEVEKGLTVTR